MSHKGEDATSDSQSCNPSNVVSILESFYLKQSGARCYSATQFSEIWRNYDIDGLFNMVQVGELYLSIVAGNGFIDGSELDNFLGEFFQSSWCEEFESEAMTKVELSELKRQFLEEFDDNRDLKIDISELANILPTDEEFILLFNLNNPLKSSVHFIQIWKEFDKDCSGYIEADELRDFLISLIKDSKPGSPITEETILEYTTSILELFDFNNDGKLQLSEMARLLPVKENYLMRPIFKNASRITVKDIERVFKMYDQDFNGTIEDEELEGFLKDLLELVQEDYDKDDMEFFKKVILDQWDVNHDGKINLNELRMMLMQQAEIAKKQNRKPMKLSAKVFRKKTMK